VDTSAAGTVRIKKKGKNDVGGKEESSGSSSIGMGTLSSGMKAAKKNSVAIGAKVLILIYVY
jgi:hypothetical protein